VRKKIRYKINFLNSWNAQKVKSIIGRAQTQLLESWPRLMCIQRCFDKFFLNSNFIYYGILKNLSNLSYSRLRYCLLLTCIYTDKVRPITLNLEIGLTAIRVYWFSNILKFSLQIIKRIYQDALNINKILVVTNPISAWGIVRKPFTKRRE
jgi:hypothetical protein